MRIRKQSIITSAQVIAVKFIVTQQIEQSFELYPYSDPFPHLLNLVTWQLLTLLKKKKFKCFKRTQADGGLSFGLRLE